MLLKLKSKQLQEHKHLQVLQHHHQHLLGSHFFVIRYTKKTSNKSYFIHLFRPPPPPAPAPDFIPPPTGSNGSSSSNSVSNSSNESQLRLSRTFVTDVLMPALDQEEPLIKIPEDEKESIFDNKQLTYLESKNEDLENDDCNAAKDGSDSESDENIEKHTVMTFDLVKDDKLFKLLKTSLPSETLETLIAILKSEENRYVQLKQLDSWNPRGTRKRAIKYDIDDEIQQIEQFIHELLVICIRFAKQLKVLKDKFSQFEKKDDLLKKAELDTFTDKEKFTKQLMKKDMSALEETLQNSAKMARELNLYEVKKSQMADLNDWLDTDQLVELALGLAPDTNKICELISQLESSKVDSLQR